MIILINGASSTGKTYLAQKILESYYFTYYSIDHIKMGLFRGDPKCLFSPTDDNRKISKSLAPIIEGIIRTAIENKQNLTIEGCYFDPESISKLYNDYPDDLLLISLTMSSEYCKNYFDSRVIKFRNAIEQRTYDDQRSLNQFINENKEMHSFSKENKFNIFTVLDDYDSCINEIIDFIKIRYCSLASKA